MKYLILLYGNEATLDWEQLSKELLERLLTEMDGFVRELKDSGELVTTDGLAHPSQAKTVWLRDGLPVVTDGPYGETKEVLAGYFILDCDTLDRAVTVTKELQALHAR